MKITVVVAGLLILICGGIGVHAEDSSPMKLACSEADDPQMCRNQNRLRNAAPVDGKIVIKNVSGSTIFKIYAWPSDLNPRTLNILDFPLKPGDTTDIVVDNSYADCGFIFQYDLNDPRKAKTRRSYLSFKPLKAIAADICGGRTFVWLGAIPDGKIQGKP